jgi:hypothetical protein
LLQTANFTQIDRLLQLSVPRIETPIKSKEDAACLGTQDVDAPLRI